MYGHNEGVAEKGVFRAAFSAGPVGPPIVGERYE